MTRLYHTPISPVATANPASLNTPLGELDAALYNLVTGGVDFPEMTSEPSNPDDGFWRWYFYDDAFYIQDESSSGIVSAAAVSYAHMVYHNVNGGDGGDFTLGDWRQRPMRQLLADDDNLIRLGFPFNSGSREPLAGETVEGASYTQSAVVVEVEVDSGTWAGGDAAGTIWVNQLELTSNWVQTGTLWAQNMDIGAEANILTITSNVPQISLAAGTYTVHGYGVCYLVDENQMRLYDVDNSVVLIQGHSCNMGAGVTVQDAAYLCGQFTLTARAVIELQHQCVTTNAGDGMGNSSSQGVVEVFAMLDLWRDS